LRSLIETRPRTASILIVCDIHPPKGEAYDGLIKEIQSLGVWWHHLESTWVVKSIRTPGEIRDQLKCHIGTDDQLLVIDISKAPSEWFGINQAGSNWLNVNI
jgi:hypothetical protein